MNVNRRLQQHFNLFNVVLLTRFGHWTEAEFMHLCSKTSAIFAILFTVSMHWFICAASNISTVSAYVYVF